MSKRSTQKTRTTVWRILKSQPNEFSIEKGQWPHELIPAFEALSNSLKKPAKENAKASDTDQFVAGLASRLWRVRQKMLKPGSNEPLDDVRSAFRHLSSVFDLLEQEGIHVRDHTNEHFDSGMMLHVIAYEPFPGLEVETVIETIKPTIICQGRPIQIAEVIVGTPKGTNKG